MPAGYILKKIVHLVFQITFQTIDFSFEILEKQKILWLLMGGIDDSF